MAVYITYEYRNRNTDGSKPCIMTADNREQLHSMAKLIHAENNTFCDNFTATFYVLSKTQMKKAIANGALRGKQASEVIRYKKMFPTTQQMD